MEEKEGTQVLGYDVFSRYRGELMGFAMVWILLFHAFQMTPETGWFRGWKERGYLGVDIFIFLSALGLSLSLCRRKQSYWAYLKRRLVRVMPTYWLVVGLYDLFLRLQGRTSLKVIAWTMSTLYYWFNKPNYFNWYIPGLLFFYLLAPAVTALLRRVKYPGCLTAVLCALSLPLYYLANLHGFAHILDVVQRVPVFLLGTLAGIYIHRGRALTYKRLWLWAALPFLVPIVNALAAPYYLSRCLNFAFGCVAVCLLLCGLAAVMPDWLRRAPRLLGECSLEIYLLNVVFVREYGRLSAFVPLGTNHRLYYALTIPANILLGVALHFLLKRPLAWLGKKVTG